MVKDSVGKGKRRGRFALTNDRLRKKFPLRRTGNAQGRGTATLYNQVRWLRPRIWGELSHPPEQVDARM